MKNNIHSVLLGFLVMGMSACGTKENQFDASGSFEAEEIIISSEATGVLKEFNIEEGQELAEGERLGYVDSLQLHLKKKQLLASINAVESKKPNVNVQLAAYQEQLKTLQTEKKRMENLVKADAAPSQQLDDINAKIDVVKAQIEAMRSTLQITSGGISKETVPLEIQIEQINDQINKCNLINPVKGTVLVKYAEENEMTAPGKPLYKIADLSNMILRAYITGDQLPTVKLNQKVKVSTDDGEGGFKETEGIIIWINDKAEFTPKTIQTKSERANMVYAIKIKVKNEGSYKIGMYGEVKF